MAKVIIETRLRDVVRLNMEMQHYCCPLMGKECGDHQEHVCYVPHHSQHSLEEARSE